MGRSIEAIVNPDVLVWARESSRLTIDAAAKKLGISPERLNEWESGTLRPTINQLRKMSEVYKRPLAVFYLAEPPKTFDVMRDFRRLPNGADRGISPELAVEIRKALYRRYAAIQLMQELNDVPPTADLAISVEDDRESTAKAIRDYLGVTLRSQFAWSNRRKAFNAWKSAIEARGVLVFQTERVALDEMRGMSIGDSTQLVIVLNGQDSLSGKMFSLTHEFVHLLLHNGGICDLDEYGDTAKIEAFCNHVAGAVLVPASSLTREPLVVQHTSGQWSDDELNLLADRYKVSTETLLRRLVLTGRASKGFYEAKRRKFLALYAEQRRLEREAIRDSGGHPAHHQLLIRANGIRYTRLVLSAYYDRTISASELSDLLGMRLKHLGSIEREVFRDPEGMS